MFFAHRRTTALAPDDLVTRRQAEVMYLATTLGIASHRAATLAFLGYVWEQGGFDPPRREGPTLPEGWLTR